MFGEHLQAAIADFPVKMVPIQTAPVQAPLNRARSKIQLLPTVHTIRRAEVITGRRKNCLCTFTIF